MTRREALSACVGAAAVAATGAVGATEPALNRVWRYDYTADSWTRCRMYELRKGDVFRIEDLGVFRANGEPYKAEAVGGSPWGINADIVIDPQTNQWVPVDA